LNFYLWLSAASLEVSIYKIKASDTIKSSTKLQSMKVISPEFVYAKCRLSSSHFYEQLQSDKTSFKVQKIFAKLRNSVIPQS
jgi:hypothetical protein